MQHVAAPKGKVLCWVRLTSVPYYLSLFNTFSMEMNTHPVPCADLDVLCVAELGWKATCRTFLELESPFNFPGIMSQPRGSGFTER